MSKTSSAPLQDALSALNPQQQEAVRHFEGPILVLAGAGSGKTRVLTSRIARLVHEHGVPAGSILAVTFTNKAANEMRERISRFLGGEPRGMWMGTFHSLGARILRRHAPHLGWSHTFSIFDAEQSLRLIKRVQETVRVDPKRWSPKAVRSQVSAAKNQLISPEDFVEDNGESFDLFARMVAKVYPEYQAELRKQNAMDFDDLLVKPVELFRQSPEILESYRQRFTFVLVDEYQDTNRAQFVFLDLLARNHENLMVVGDDDQSIYGWRGADIRNILDFEKTFPGAAIVRLEQNYRSTSKILDAANAVIDQNVNRKGKTLRTDREPGDGLTLLEAADERDEARWLAGEVQSVISERNLRARDVALLYRTNAQSRALEDAFRRAGIPYQIVGGVRFYERREIQDVLSYLRLISNPHDTDAFLRVANYPRRGLGKTSQERLSQWAAVQGLSLLEAATLASQIPGISTGGARGLLEFTQLIQRFSALASQVPVGELLEQLIEDLDLLRRLRDEGPEGDDRAENVKELIAGAMDFDAELLEDLEVEGPDPFTELDLFLQQVALVADIDRHDADADTVTLMTLHNAKGLEYPAVFICGLEDGLFPLARAYDDPSQLEEERRLFYVGITRAKQKLYLSFARQRRRAGEFTIGRLSSFVDAIPETLLERRRTERLRRDGEFGSRRMRRPAREGRGMDPDLDLDTGMQDTGMQDAGMQDAAMNQDLPRFIKGERVAHGTFGSGSVLEVSGFGRDLKVTVDFDSVGRKKMLVRYAGLEKDYF